MKDRLRVGATAIFTALKPIGAKGGNTQTNPLIPQSVRDYSAKLDITKSHLPGPGTRTRRHGASSAEK